MTPSEFRAMGITETLGRLVEFGRHRLWIDEGTWNSIPEGERFSVLTEYLRSKTEDGLQAPVSSFTATTTFRIEMEPERASARNPGPSPETLHQFAMRVAATFEGRAAALEASALPESWNAARARTWRDGAEALREEEKEMTLPEPEETDGH